MTRTIAKATKTNGSNGSARTKRTKRASQELEFHPLANVFPMLDDTELGDLANDIKANGLLMPVILYEGKILDGRNRYRACKLADVQPRFEEWEGDGDPLEYVLSLNLQRRHLTTGQRAMVATKVVPMLRRNGIRNKTQAAVAAGKPLGVSGTAVGHAQAIVNRGIPGIAKAVEDGTVSLKDAVTAVDDPPAVQRRALNKVRTGQMAKLVDARREEGTAAVPYAPEQLRSFGKQIQQHASRLFAVAEELMSADVEEISLTYGRDFSRAIAVLNKFACHAEDVGKRKLAKEHIANGLE